MSLFANNYHNLLDLSLRFRHTEYRYKMKWPALDQAQHIAGSLAENRHSHVQRLSTQF